MRGKGWHSQPPDLKCNDGSLFKDRSPVAGQPRWIAASENSELVYLSWGIRDFSRHPISEHRNPGWSYVIVSRGTVRFFQAASEVTVGASQCVVTAPSCSHGFRHEAGEHCKVLTWIFRSAPAHPELAIGNGSFRLFDLEPAALQAVEHLHAQSRQEIIRMQGLFERSIQHFRDLLDIQLVRSLSQPPASPLYDDRLERARHWMRSNLELADPVRSLCSYLQVSQSTLYRLFQRGFGMSPRAVHNELRMLEAKRLIEQEGWQVKQAAYRLGYRHPCDLSRALSRFHDQLACKP